MLVDLVQVTTSDGVRLHGALELAAGSPSPRADAPAIDVWLCLHGTGSNFYAASTLAGLAPKLLATGAAVLRVNTRGHDIICTGPSAGGRWLQGAAFERVDEAPLDLRAWLEFLAERGFARVGVLGHSLGAVKAISTLAADDAAPVAALAAVSPPRLSYASFVASPRKDEFLATFAKAEELVRQGRGEELLFVNFPLPYYVTATGYVDRYGPEERYNVLRYLARMRQPTLVTFGSAELSNAAFAGVPEAIERLAKPDGQLQVAVIAGADHIYAGCHDALAAVVGRWVKQRMKDEG
jgi:pimeloyl-ACP methyl ester carboxylesterase